MNMVTPPPRRRDLHTATDGEFAGWSTWLADSYEAHNGPFWHRIEADQTVRCAFRVEEKHLNGQRSVHGGCYMTFADYCLFAFARPYMEGSKAVTIAFSGEFLDGATTGELVEATGEVTRAGGSLIFVRGKLHSGDRTLFTFSGTIKRVKKRPPAQAAE